MLAYAPQYAGKMENISLETIPRAECDNGCGQGKPDLALVTIRALFGIKFVRGHAEHVVALDADAMQHGRFGWGSGAPFLLRPRAFGSIHDGGILPRRAHRPLERGGQHPGTCAGHLTEGVMRVEKMANLLIDFRLSIRSTI